MKTKFLLMVLVLLASLMASISFSQVDPASRDYELLKLSGALPTSEQVVTNGPITTIVPTQSATENGCLLIPLDVATFSYLDRNDDGSTGQIFFPFDFDFYGTIQNFCWINNNGNVSFDGPYGSYTATGFPVNGFPMLAPFWADVDTRNIESGLMWYKVEPHRVTVIWDSVGYYGAHADKLNTFELIFTDGTDPLVGIGNNVAFSYDDMQWTTGDASGGSGGFGGTPSTCGVNKGDGSVYALIGRFDHEGLDYDGPGGIADGVSYLDCKNFFFNTSTFSNIPPVASGFPASPVTINVGDVWNYTVQFLSPELGQTTSTVINGGGLSDFVYSITDGNVSEIEMQITGTFNNIGTHTIVFTASDDGVPAGVTTVYLDIIVEPVVVPCPLTAIWNGSVSTDWFIADNWTTPDGALVPCGNTVVTIPAGCPNYPTIIAPPTTSVACYVTIAALTINDGGSLIGQQYLCVNSDVVVERSVVNSNFHLIGSPVDAIPALTFGDVFSGAVYFDVWAREYNELSGDWENRFIWDNLAVGKGYSVQINQSVIPQTATFTGLLNGSDGFDEIVTLYNENTSGLADRVGWNLLGNPFPSALDWDFFTIPGEIVDGAVYVWDESYDDGFGGNYRVWNGTGGSLTNGIIPAQQGFFVKTSTNGAALIIPISAQVHSPMTLYKDAVANALELRANGNNYGDATFVHFNNDATPGFDNRYDAFKLTGLETAPQLYSLVAGYNLSINELPFEGNEVVNLGFKCGVAGTYSLSATGMESFSNTTPILLEDLKLNILQDLRLNPVYSFNYLTNDNEARFKLHFKAATGISDPANSGIFVYSYERTLVINNTTGLNGEVSIFDMTGRELKDASMSCTSVTRIPMQAAVGNYIVKVTTDQGTVNQKVFIK